MITIISYLYFAPLKNENGLIYFQGIITLKSIIGYNNKLETNIFKYLLRYNNFFSDGKNILKKYKILNL